MRSLCREKVWAYLRLREVVILVDQTLSPSAMQSAPGTSASPSNPWEITAESLQLNLAEWIAERLLHHARGKEYAEIPRQWLMEYVIRRPILEKRRQQQ